MTYLRVYVPAALLAEEGEDGAAVFVVDTEAPTPGNAAIARCSDGVTAQTIVDALNA